MENKIYDIDELNLIQHTTNLIISKRCWGKTKICLNLIKYYTEKYDFNYVFLFSETGTFNPDWTFIDKKYISPMWDSKLSALLKYQEKKIISKKTVNALIILDDIKINDKSKILNDIFTTGRHYKITIIVSVQFGKCIIWPSVRNNIDYLFFSEVNNDCLESIYKWIATKKFLKILLLLKNLLKTIIEISNLYFITIKNMIKKSEYQLSKHNYMMKLNLKNNLFYYF